MLPLVPVTHTVPLQVLLKCPSVSFPFFSLWFSGKEGSLPSLQGRANSKLAHPSLLMSGASCGWMFRDWHHWSESTSQCLFFLLARDFWFGEKIVSTSFKNVNTQEIAFHFDYLLTWYLLAGKIYIWSWKNNLQSLISLSVNDVLFWKSNCEEKGKHG